MSGNTGSVGKTEETGSTAANAIHEQEAMEQAMEEAQEIAEEVMYTVAESTLPPGVHIPRKDD